MSGRDRRHHKKEAFLLYNNRERKKKEKEKRKTLVQVQLTGIIHSGNSLAPHVAMAHYCLEWPAVLRRLD